VGRGSDGIGNRPIVKLWLRHCSRAVGPGSTPGLGIVRDLFLEPMQSVATEWTLNCVCVPLSGPLLVRHW
jgi:hypothetical protein